MKKNLFIAATAVLSVIVLAAGIQSDTGIAGRTGAPSETTCNTTNCHNSFTLNSGIGSVAFSCDNMPNWAYVAGTTYHMHFKVKRTGTSLFGCGVEALDSAGRNAGSLLVTDLTHTTSKLATIGANTRKAITHKLNGGASPDSMTFNFDWVAPTTGVSVTFYCAGNCANANGSPLGDYIYTTTQHVVPDVPNGVSLVENIRSSIYPNPAHDRISLSYFQHESGQIAVRLYTLNGELAKDFLNEFRTAGEYHDQFSGLEQLSPGIYYLRIENGIASSIQKVVIL